MSFQGKVVITGKIGVVTGLHIGGNKSALDIGGVDNAFIRTKKGRVFIPGSSLRGKIRSLLEKAEDVFEANGEPSGSVNDVTKIFGIHKAKNNEEIKPIKPVTLIVRDAYLSDRLNEGENEKKNEREFLEIKTENTINRITGKASKSGPREIERVSEGAEFLFEMIFNLNYDESENEKLLKQLFKGMKLLEDDYLGGSGTRGYGKVKFIDLKLELRSKDYYEGKADPKPQGPFKEIDELIKKENILGSF
jgi:CRISPR-associated protein Csm3